MPSILSILQISDNQVRSKAMQHGQRLVGTFDCFDFVLFGTQANA